jgi:hypothetical protein
MYCFFGTGNGKARRPRHDIAAFPNILSPWAALLVLVGYPVVPYRQWALCGLCNFFWHDDHRGLAL